MPIDIKWLRTNPKAVREWLQQRQRQGRRKGVCDYQCSKDDDGDDNDKHTQKDDVVEEANGEKEVECYIC